MAERLPRCLRRAVRAAAALSGLAGLLVSGCNLKGVDLGAALSSAPAPTAAAESSARFAQGTAELPRAEGRPPAGGRTPLEDRPTLESNAGIIAKNSSKFTGSVMAPPAIIAKNSSKFRVARLDQVPWANGTVFLNRADGMLFLVDGKVVSARTDAAGRYSFGEFTVPPGTDVVVTAFFPGNRHLTCFRRSAPGDNALHLDVSSTFADEYLVAAAKRRGKALGDFPTERIAEIERLTRVLLDRDAALFMPDLLRADRKGALVAAYEASFKAHSPALVSAWTNLLGPEPTPSATPAGSTSGMAGPVQVERLPGI